MSSDLSRFIFSSFGKTIQTVVPPCILFGCELVFDDEVNDLCVTVFFTLSTDDIVFCTDR